MKHLSSKTGAHTRSGFNIAIASCIRILWFTPQPNLPSGISPLNSPSRDCGGYGATTGDAETTASVARNGRQVVCTPFEPVSHFHVERWSRTGGRCAPSNTGHDWHPAGPDIAIAPGGFARRRPVAGSSWRELSARANGDHRASNRVHSPHEQEVRQDHQRVAGTRAQRGAPQSGPTYQSHRRPRPSASSASRCLASLPAKVEYSRRTTAPIRLFGMARAGTTCGVLVDSFRLVFAWDARLQSLFPVSGDDYPHVPNQLASSFARMLLPPLTWSR